MRYDNTINYLFNRLPMFQRSGPVAYKSSLDTTLALDRHYKHPHRNFKTIHVGGTNGKGSVSHMLASVLQSAGYKTGLYTSPHLKDFRERIRVNGEMMQEQEVVEWVGKYRENNKVWKIEPSFFELTVAMAFDHFAQQHVDVAVVEVGLGGRLDSTNIILPEVSIITNIGFDHTNLLGDTIAQIAMEKAGIIKSKVPIVIGTTQKDTEPIFREKANKLNAALFFADKEFEVEYAMKGVDGKQIVKINKNGESVYSGLKLDLPGLYQQKNIPAVLKAIDILNQGEFEIPEKNIYSGLSETVKNTHLLGRWQIIGNNPLVVCDTGHNEDGIKALVEQIKFTPHKNLHIVFGTVGDKEPYKVLAHLPQKAEYYFVRAKISRAMDEKVLAEKAKEYGLIGKCYSSVNQALKVARNNAAAADFIFVGGSTFVVAEVI